MNKVNALLINKLVLLVEMCKLILNSTLKNKIVNEILKDKYWVFMLPDF